MKKDRKFALSLQREYGKYFVSNNSTVRKTAKHFMVSKSKTHAILSSMNEKEMVLKKDKELAKAVVALLAKNKSERHIRGGAATREKYLKLKSKEN